MEQITLKEWQSHITAEKGIDFIFKQNPTFETIGTKEQYATYLTTIFPNSKVQDIVFFGSINEITAWRNNQHFGSLNAAISRATFLKQITARFDKQSYIYPVILNIKNIKRVNDADYAWDSVIQDAKSEKYDGLVYLNNNEGKDADSYVIFEPTQAFTLGTQQDLEWFTTYINTFTTSKSSQIFWILDETN